MKNLCNEAEYFARDVLIMLEGKVNLGDFMMLMQDMSSNGSAIRLMKKARGILYGACKPLQDNIKAYQKVIKQRIKREYGLCNVIMKEVLYYVQ